MYYTVCFIVLRNVLAEAAQVGHVIFSAIRHKVALSAPTSPIRRVKGSRQQEQDAVNIQTELLRKSQNSSPSKEMLKTIPTTIKGVTTKSHNASISQKVPKPRQKKRKKLLEEQKREISSPINTFECLSETRPIGTDLQTREISIEAIRAPITNCDNNVAITEQLSENVMIKPSTSNAVMTNSDYRCTEERPSEGPILVPPDLSSTSKFDYPVSEESISGVATLMEHTSAKHMVQVHILLSILDLFRFMNMCVEYVMRVFIRFKYYDTVFNNPSSNLG